MKFKEIESTSNVVWSPHSFFPVALAAGSAAQHVDSSFSSNAALELYELNLNDPGYEMERKVSVPCERKFQKLVWSSGGVLVGGCDGGLLEFYDVNSLLNKREALVSSNNKHNGSVSALDLNPFQNNLFSSGAADSEIYIWDLNNTTTPMAPGNKAQPHEHVQGLAWNRQVQHILASSFSTRCIVWDLRKNEPIIKLSDGQARTRWKSVVWHPSVATQLCLASEDDSTPVVQLWDLRLATAPLLTLERHQKGVLALSWCQQDPDLLLSASKDGRVLCWNPNNNTPGGEILSEICSTGQWVFDVQWCPRNPNLVVACSNDGRIGVYSINGGLHLQPVATSNKIMDSFPGMENLQQAPVPSMSEMHTSPQILPRPPLWTKRPIRASFGFGGKLVTFHNQNESTSQREVFISQIITDTELIERAKELERIMNVGENERQADLFNYCSARSEQVMDVHEKYIWRFLKANFHEDHRTEMLNLLGFRREDMNNKLNSHFAKLDTKNVDHITDRPSGLSRSESSETEAEPSTDTSTDISGGDATSAFDTIAEANRNVESNLKPFTIPTGDDPEGLICQALMSNNLEIAVDLCMEAGRTSDALVIACSGGSNLLSQTQWRYLSQRSGPVASLTSALLDSNWTNFVLGVAPSGWKAALATALTHCTPGELYIVCDALGKKLEKEADPSLFCDAVICYLASASIEELVKRWQSELNAKNSDSEAFMRIAELVLVAKFASICRGRPVQNASELSNFLSNYAMRLASQGFFEGALSCLSGAQNQDLIYRIQCAMGYAYPYKQQTSTNRDQWNRVRTSSYNSQNNNNNINQTLPAAYKPEPQPQPAYMQPVQQLPSQPPPLQRPPRPTSASSHGGLIGKSKYLRDPSVQSGSAVYQPPPIETQPYPQRPAYVQPGIPGIPPIQSSYNPQPTLNYGQTQSTPSILQPGVPPLNPIDTNPPTETLNGNSSFYNRTELGVESMPPSYVQAPSGWNDPPVLSKNKSQPSTDYVAATPITHPLFGANPPQHVPLTGPMPYQEPVNQYAPPLQPPMTGMMPSHPVPARENIVKPPPAPIQKGPIPEQHIHMQTVFDALRAQCSQSTNNPQIKRKLDDVQKKLETLYDLLRENKLSDNAIGTLHHVVQLVQGGDYNNSLSMLTSMASGPDFSTIASFLPSLKIMIQTANSLPIYLR